MLGLRLLLTSFVNLVIFLLMLFLPAGTWHWWRAWVYLAVVVAASVVTMVLVFAGNKGLLAERLKPPLQRGQPLSDKILVVLLLVALCVQTVLIPLDVFRFHLLARPGAFVSSLGLVLSLIGWWIISLAFKANAFAAPVVRHQVERQHQVADRGAYGVVRHPMYAGLILYELGLALWLESYAAALANAIPAVILALRILAEERFLKRELPGYADYMRRVRWRMIPFLW